MPKTAGTTLRLVAEDNLDGQDWQNSIVDRELAHLLIGQPKLPKLPRHSFLSGHLPLSFRDMLKPPVVTVCSIREPVDLIVSYFAFHQAIGIIPADITLDTFLASEAACVVINLQSRFIANLEFPQFPKNAGAFRTVACSDQRHQMQMRYGGDAIRRAALENGQGIDIVVDAGDLPAGVQAMCARFGWLMPSNLPLRNIGGYARTGVTQSSRDTIAELCSIDQEIYAFLRSRTAIHHGSTSLTLQVCDETTPFAVDFAQSVSGSGWHMREFVEDWGWTRWSSESSTIDTNLSLSAGRYQLGLFILDCIDPACLGLIEIDFAGMTLRPRFIRETTVWRGWAELLVPAAVTATELVLRVSGAKRPCDMGANEDNRVLGVRVKSIIVTWAEKIF